MLIADLMLLHFINSFTVFLHLGLINEPSLLFVKKTKSTLFLFCFFYEMIYNLHIKIGQVQVTKTWWVCSVQAAVWIGQYKCKCNSNNSNISPTITVTTTLTPLFHLINYFHCPKQTLILSPQYLLHLKQEGTDP